MNLRMSVSRKTKHAKFPEKRTSLTSWYAHVRVSIRGKKCCFFIKFGELCFVQTPVLGFTLLPYYRRYQVILWVFSPIFGKIENKKLFRTDKTPYGHDCPGFIPWSLLFLNCVNDLLDDLHFLKIVHSRSYSGT